MQNLIKWWDQKTGAAALLLALLLGAGACGIKSQDRPGQTAVVLDLRQAADQSAALPGPLLSSPAASGERLVGLLKITAPDLTEPVRFLLPDLQLGSVQTIWAPSGPARTFELLIYDILPGATTADTFPATLLITLTPRDLRTLDLIGEQVALELVMAANTSLAQVGTYNSDGYIEINRSGAPELLPGNCGIVANATMIDPEFNSLRLGPFPLNIGLNPGEYLISQVPAGRSFKLALENPFAGWSGESDETLVSDTLNPNPINVLLPGFQLLAISPANGLVGDGLVGETVQFQPSGGFGVYSFQSRLDQMSGGSIASISNTGLYAVTGSTLGGDTLDTVTMNDACSTDDLVTAQVYWYMVPMMLDSGTYGPAVSPSSGYINGGDYVYINGQGFDANTQVFFGGNPASLYTFSYNQLYVITPRGATPDAYVDVRAFNPRSNPLFPGFVGFDSILVNAFSYYSGGCAFAAPMLPGSPDRFIYSPQDEVVQPGNAK